ncbi:ABC1 kinase family protein [Halovenus marina]|uniref:ABC1 kinase family protein n=1 Tax=Halovenus marina TaxID=3396621 RepID=UPI003F57AE91
MNLRAYWRFLLVSWQFFPLVIAYARDRNRFLLFGRSRQVSSARRRKRAATLLDSLLTLGPTFIKLGQLLSTRPDVLPPEYIDEFSKLQDEVPPADWADAEEVIESELGPVDEQFADFDRTAISGASLGQVYLARVDGQQVAVKVRRPGVEELVEADLRVIRWLLPLVMRFVDDSRSFSLETLADEFGKTIRQEMNYEREGQMLQDIRANFDGNDAVQIPAIVESHSTERVLTMEYVEGTKITDTDRLDEYGIDRSELAERLQRTYMQMVVDDGVFHADPHPGNLAVQPDGTLVLYDFGMSGYVDQYVQDHIVDFYGAIARQDIDAILDALIEMGTLSPEADREVMGDVMELAIADARGQDIEQYRVQQIIQQVEDTIYEFPLRLPSNLALVLRVATVVEGVCVTLDPDFDFISVATDYLREEGYIQAGVREYLTDRGQELTDAAQASIRVPPKLESALDRIERENLHVQADIEDSDDHFDRLARRLIYGMWGAAGAVSTAILYAFEELAIAAVTGAATVVVLALLYWSFRGRRGIRAQPQFTRQRLRERESENAMGFGDVGANDSDTTEFDAHADTERARADSDDGGHSIPVSDGASDEETDPRS